MQFLIRYAHRLWPQLKPFKFTHGWNGQLAVTTDHYPHIHEPAEGVLVCLGYNGRGVAMSTAMGPELARRIIGGTSAEMNMPDHRSEEHPLPGPMADRCLRPHHLWPHPRLSAGLMPPVASGASRRRRRLRDRPDWSI